MGFLGNFGCWRFSNHSFLFVFSQFSILRSGKRKTRQYDASIQKVSVELLGSIARDEGKNNEIHEQTPVKQRFNEWLTESPATPQTTSKYKAWFPRELEIQASCARLHCLFILRRMNRQTTDSPRPSPMPASAELSKYPQVPLGCV